MQTARRSFLSMIVVTLAGVRVLFAKGQGDGPRMPMSQPDPGWSGREIPRTQIDNPVSRQRNLTEQLKQNQKDLRRDVDQLLELAKELKNESDKTEQTNVMSLSLIRKAEEIEKLARQIKGLVRAA
jgi:hypothetical protein